MSTRWTPTKSTPRQQKLQWINMLCHFHDTICDCCQPLVHTVSLIFEQEKNLPFNTQEKDLIQKCLSGDAHTATDGAAEDNFGEGDLEKLFDEPFTAEDDEG